MNKAIIIIPARYGSSRLPGKPLAPIAGKSLLERTWSIAKAVQHIEGVYIATDDERIKAHAEQFGAQVIMTPVDIPNGTERVFHAAQSLGGTPDIILNLQGDAVLTPPWVIQALIDTVLADSNIGFATTAMRLSLEQYQQMAQAKRNGAVGGTTVVCDKQGYALYFSKSLIPFMREIPTERLPVFRHIGLYVYRYDILKHYLTLPPTELELVEGLEQLRALEYGIPIKVVEVDYRGRTHCAVDSQADIDYVESLIAKEGELLA
ncbi:MAG TPA: 3-deoxy-manno-octulosonate cytidylyltransferase [Legionellaceae bacterium]|nr:3-deoxy-manno-octulosonate cytidylyltransferase [Legionellaceae bacterium]